MIRLLLFMLLVVTPPLSAQHVLNLANGDRLSGRLQRIEDSSWVFRFDGTALRIPVSRVRSLETTLIGVRLADGTIGAATIGAAPEGLAITFATGATQLVSPRDLAAVGNPDNLAALEPIDIGLFTPFDRFWGGNGSLGFSDQSGNSRARGLTATLEVSRRSPTDRLRLQLGMIREQSETVTGEFEPTVAKAYGSLRADVFFTSRFFTFAETRQERDTFQDISLRSTYGGGLGWQIIATRATELSLATSGGARREQFVDGTSNVAAVVKPNVALRQTLGPIRLEWDLSSDANVEDLSDFQFRSQAGLTTTVYRGLGVRVGILNEFDNTPRPGVEKHDMLVTTTLAYSIGN